jgi:hypothetical protein
VTRDDDDDDDDDNNNNNNNSNNNNNNNNNNCAVCANFCGRSFTSPRMLKFCLVTALGKKMQFSVEEKFSTM